MIIPALLVVSTSESDAIWLVCEHAEVVSVRSHHYSVLLPSARLQEKVIGLLKSSPPWIIKIVMLCSRISLTKRLPLCNRSMALNTFRSLFTKFLTPRLTCELDKPLDDWLESISPTNHPAGYLISGLTWELKIWWIRPSDFQQWIHSAI